MAAVWVRDAISGRVSAVSLPRGASVRDLLNVRCCNTAPGIQSLDIYVKCNGRIISLKEELQDGFLYSLEPRLLGGKGGFGSMLRALGAQIEKTTNREACRDLSGRRLRDVNHEKAMAEWIKKQAEREAEKEQRRLERLQRKLAEPKHYFTDPEYHQQCSDMSERLEDSVIKGLQASSSTVVLPEASDSRKRAKDLEKRNKKSSKKQCFWTGVEELDVSSGSDGGSDSDSESPCSSSSSSSSSSMSREPSNGSGLRCQSDSDGSEQQPSVAALEENAALQGTRIPQETPEFQQIPEAGEKNNCPQLAQNKESSRIDLLALESAEELEALGLETLKLELMGLGLKCGGTLQERAARLYSVRGLSKDQIDPSLFAKQSKGKK